MSNNRVLTNPGSTHRDDVSTGRQLASGRLTNQIGTRNKEIVNLSVKASDQESHHQNPDLEIILEAEEFEEPTKYSRIRLSLGIIMLASLALFLVYICVYELENIHFNALLKSMGYTVISLCVYLLLVLPIWILIVSI